MSDRNEPEREPPLTADEWKARRMVPLSLPELSVHDDGDGLEFCTYDGAADDPNSKLLGKYKIDTWDRDGIAGVMALANLCLPDDDPWKLTRRDVEALRLIATVGVRHTHDAETLHCIADKLTALLPPES